MALPRKPHTLTFAPVTEPLDAENVVQPPTEGNAVSIQGQLTPLTSQAAFDRFGVELSRPHLWMCDDTDSSSIKVGYRATYGSRKFEVKSPPMIWDAISAISCAECVLEEREYI